MNTHLKQAVPFVLASIVFTAAATSTAPQSGVRPAPTEQASTPSFPVCVQTAAGYVCKTAP